MDALVVRLTSVHNIILMTIIQGTANLPCKFTSNSFFKPVMTYNVIQHLDIADILKDHVIMVFMDNHLVHCTDVGMVKESREGNFMWGSDFLGCIFGGFGCDILGFIIIAMGRRWAEMTNDLDSKLCGISSLVSMYHWMCHGNHRTHLFLCDTMCSKHYFT
jgi:hypothetical protein